MADEWISLEVQGLAKLENNLMQLGEELSKKVFPAAARKANKLMKERIESNAPRGTRPLEGGRTIRLHEGILQRSSVKSDGVAGATVVVLTGLRKESKTSPSVVRHGYWLEFGTVKMQARPWMRPAFEEEKNNVIKEFGELLREGIQKAATKHGVQITEYAL